MKTEHAPTPWQAKDSHFIDGEHRVTLIDATGRVICTMPQAISPVVLRACNNHERLVDALKELRLQCQQSRKFIALCDEGYELYRSTAAAIERADVALEGLNQ